MSDYLIVDGDALKFEKMFGINEVTPTGACVINGSGEVTIENKKVAVLGDEKKVSIAASYKNSTFMNPGTGNITITSLDNDQQAPFVTAITPVIVAGSKFSARFTVVTPATDATGKPDSVLVTNGLGQFGNSQTFVKASPTSNRRDLFQ